MSQSDGEDVKGDRGGDTGNTKHQEKGETAEKGDIVVFGIPGEEATVKTFSRKGNKVVLLPANSRFEPIVLSPDDVRIYGKVVSVLRKV